MEQKICCVCHKPVGEDARTLGGRFYCDEHYAKVTRERKGVWQSGIAEIVAVLFFVALVEVIITLAKPTLAVIWMFLASTISAIFSRTRSVTCPAASTVVCGKRIANSSPP